MQFDCCGRASPQDYIVAGRLPPPTCFVGHDASLAENLIESGCRIKFEDYWLELLGIFNILACVLIGLEVGLGKNWNLKGFFMLFGKLSTWNILVI